MKRLKGEGGHAALPDLFGAALDRVCGAAPAARMAVAFSGGLDSTVLLHLAAGYCRAAGLPLLVFHVHHGLSLHADAWLEACAAAAAALGLPFYAERVQVERAGKGVEAGARSARYAALGALCRAHGADLLLTAHHLDDQAETVLLQLLRGAGTAGLGGMDECHTAPGLLGTDTLRLARPLLGAARAQLEAWARAQALRWVEDESNASTAYARNALRHDVMPALAQLAPGYPVRLARAAAHARAAQGLLDVLADQDLAAAGLPGGALSCAALRTLGVHRANNLLRRWLHLAGVAMPSTAWLAQLLSQATEAREDAQLRVHHPECELRRYRDALHLVRQCSSLPAAPLALVWHGEAALAAPAFGGVLQVAPAASGIDPDWLRGRPLSLAAPRGSLLFKPAANRPSRSLKHHHQAAGVPPWERARLPVVYAGGQLLYVAGLGLDARVPAASPGLQLRWAGAD